MSERGRGCLALAAYPERALNNTFVCTRHQPFFRLLSFQQFWKERDTTSKNISKERFSPSLAFFQHRGFLCQRFDRNLLYFRFSFP